MGTKRGSLASLFNQSLDSGHAGTSRMEVSKCNSSSKGDDMTMTKNDDISNFRPVSCSTASCQFERLPSHQFYSYLQKHSILNPAQSGFIQTQDVIVSMVDSWRCTMPQVTQLILRTYREEKQERDHVTKTKPVSYTHLTLPTICSV